MTKQQEGRVVGPVHVVENHHDRLRSRDPGEQRGEHLEQSVALGLSLRLAVGEADDHRIARRGNRHLGQSTDELPERANEVGLKTMERFAQGRWGAPATYGRSASTTGWYGMIASSSQRP